MKYDAPFVFSEVNADMVYWIVHPNGERTQVSVNSTTVGRNISTKSVYGDYREDITANYKHPEGILLNSQSDPSLCVVDNSLPLQVLCCNYLIFFIRFHNGEKGL